MRKLVFGLFSTLLLFSSCQNDNIINQDDEILVQLMENASKGSGMNFFKLPDSDDYSSIPQDPNNQITREKVVLGQFLFHETALGTESKSESGMHTYSCSSCHHARAGFQSGRVQGIADGGIGFGIRGEGRNRNPLYETDSLDIQPIRSPSILNSAYQPVSLWNGQFGATDVNLGTEANWTADSPKETNFLGFEGVETQAIAGLTVHRMSLDSNLVFNTDYKSLFDYAFYNVPENDRYTKRNAGLAIAAYERTVLANKSPFQKYIRGDRTALSSDEKKGAILFFGKANCVTCHTGPALNSMEFHGLGLNDLEGAGVFGNVDRGTAEGRGGFTGQISDMFKFKVPQLYSLTYSPFLGHGGNKRSVEEMIRYKNAADKENFNVPESQISEHFVPLGLSDEEIKQLTAFIESGLNDANLRRYEPISLPSGNCFPNNDPISKSEMGCY